ncbi:MAG: copper chaperone PCu(A)C [Hydrogenophaga sp.]|uniref:copper chaperone PCu(A)C n=1 Tax=Hydrogenophaga sp. TaxID=1904254 RepID=UPI001E1A69A0|nr:copper chaperone PCu(A)C [Hydrogenophaga sp.]MBX3610730.1 copper chaperone PCu(A)C [Hydrogenophaga sp.]
MKHLFLACSLAIAATAWAQPKVQVQVQEPWARATVATQSATGAFMKLTAPEAVRLVEVRSPAAGIVEVHEMKMEGDVMRMRAMPALPLAAGQTVELKPGGYHVMLMDLKAPVKAGDAVPLTLVFEGANGQRFTQEVKAMARAMGAPAGGMSMPPAGHSGHGDHKP